MMGQETNTTLASWALAIREALLQYPIDAREVFTSAGIDLSLLNDPLNRIPVDAMTRLWQRAAEMSGDECFGLTVARHVTPSSFFALGISAITSENILEIFRIASYSASLISSGLQLEMMHEHGTSIFELKLKPGFPEFAPAGLEAGFGGLIHIGRQYLGISVALDKVSFRHGAPADCQPYEDFFRCPVEFGSFRNAIYISNLQELTRRLPTANSALREANEQILADYLQKLTDQSLSNRVNNEVSVQLDEGRATDQKTISRALCMSERKLQIALKREGTSFQEILDRNRCRKAVRMLTTERVPVTQIAMAMGFKEVSSFTRAFKRWTGKTPRDFLATETR